MPQCVIMVLKIINRVDSSAFTSESLLKAIIVLYFFDNTLHIYSCVPDNIP